MKFDAPRILLKPQYNLVCRQDGKVLTANWRAITLKAFNSNLVLSGTTAGRINQVLHLLKDGRNSKTQLQWSHLKWKRICIAELVLFFQILKVIKFKLNTQITCQIKVYSKSKLQCFIKEVYLKILCLYMYNFPWLDWNYCLLRSSKPLVNELLCSTWFCIYSGICW